MTASRASSPLPSISAQRKRKPATDRLRDMRADRYDHRAAFDPRTSLSRPRAHARNPGIEVTVAAVPDPLEPGKRSLANVNRRVDLLEHELSNGRITVSQYEIGRQVQAVLERAAGARSGAGIWGVMAGAEVQKDAHGLASQEVATIRRIADAKALKDLVERIERAVGGNGLALLRELLTGAGTFKDYAKRRNALAGERDVTRIADRFRWTLEGLDEAFAARGLVQRDAEGNTRIRAEIGAYTGEETDERGRLVPAGHGHRWGQIKGE